MKIIKSPIAASLLSGCLALAGLCVTPQAAFAQAQLIDRVVAVVDNQIILQSQLQEKMREQALKMRAQNIALPSNDALAEKVLDQMILETVQLNRAQLIGIQATDDEVNQQLQKIAQQNNLNLVQLRDRVNAQSPQAFVQLRSEIEKQILIQKLREAEVINRAQVTESEIQSFLKRQSLSNTEVNLKHILVALPESATPEQRQEALNKANQLRQKILAGEDFSQLAVRFSDGGKALQGGDLGWMQPSEVPTFFNKAFSGLKKGETSEVIQSPSGFHLIQLADQRDGSDQKVTEYHLHQFVVLSDNAGREQAPKSLIQLVESIKSLKDFDALNQKFADIPKEVNRNSDLGWLNEKQLPNALREVVQSMPVKQAVGPFASEEGWLILYLDDIRQESQSDKLKAQQAMQAVRMRKANEMFDVWLRRLKDEAYIRIQLSPDA